MISSEKTSDEYLCINSCDCQRFDYISAGSRRERGRVDFHILYIAKGTCYIYENGKEISVRENSVILYLPNQPQIYSFRGEEQVVSYYIHFCGTGCEKILRELNLYGKRSVELEEDNGVERIFEKLVREFHMKRSFYEQCCNGLLLSLFSAIARSAYHIPDRASSQSKINGICIRMHNSYAENLSVADYAQILNLSTGRFTHVFTQAMGVSPKQYLISIKLDHAVELLTNTDLSVAQIAELVGIPDSNYFSRIFKKHMGHTPGFYR